jgi:hypothetical protein
MKTLHLVDMEYINSPTVCILVEQSTYAIHLLSVTLYIM